MIVSASIERSGEEYCFGEAGADAASETEAIDVLYLFSRERKREGFGVIVRTTGRH
jgi:hypothetical protein